MTKKNFEIKDDLKVTVVSEKEKGTKTIYLVGTISSHVVDEFFHKISKIDLKEYNKMIFDLKDLSYISADGLGAFLRIMQHVKKQNGEIILVSLKPRVAEVFNMLGFRNFINIVSNINSKRAAASI